MYDELVKSLRICSRCDFGQDCNGCKQKSDDAFCCDKLLHEAADAIEELQKMLEAVNDAHNEGYDVGYWAGRRDYERKWIPVTERLPDRQYPVLVYVPPYTDGEEEYVGYVGMAYFTYSPNGGFWCGTDGNIYGAIGFIHEPLAWMPLPEPPKDGDA